MQPNQDQADQELLALAQETERVAATMADTKCALRLTEIAAEVRIDGNLDQTYRRRGSELQDVPPRGVNPLL